MVEVKQQIFFFLPHMRFHLSFDVFVRIQDQNMLLAMSVSAILVARRFSVLYCIDCFHRTFKTTKKKTALVAVLIFSQCK